MKPIHLYKNGSLEQHKAISRWFYMSLFIIIAVTASMAMIHFKEWYLNSSLEDEKTILEKQLKALAPIADLQQRHKVMHEQLQQKKNKISHLQENLTHPLAILKTLKTALKDQVMLESLCLTSKNIDLKITAENTKSIIKFGKALCFKQPYENIALCAFECKEKKHISALFKN